MDLKSLYDAHKSGKEYTPLDISKDKELAYALQSRLAQFNLLENAPDGLFGKKSTQALKNFNKLALNIDSDVANNRTFEKLIESDTRFFIDGYLVDVLDDASQLLMYFILNGWKLNTNAGELNILGIRGMNKDNSLNDDKPFKYNDRIKLLTFTTNNSGLKVPKLVGNWLATTQPGAYYWHNPLGVDGCAVYPLEVQQRVYGVGYHRGYKALAQLGEVLIHRGVKQIKSRGYFGVNIHSVGVGQDYNFLDDIGMYSAGCQVLASRDEFDNQFMKAIYKDSNYVKNNKYLWHYVVIDGKRFRNFFPRYN